jgi:hypothetical protein
MLTNAGFTDIEIEEMPVNWSYGSFDEAWDFMTQVAGAISAVVKVLPRDQVQELRAALEANMEPFRSEHGLTLPGVTINVSAA